MPVKSQPSQSDYSLELLNDVANKLNEINKRWQNKLTLCGQSLVEKYREGRLTLVCDLEISSSVAGDIGSMDSPSLNKHGESGKLIASIVLQTNSLQHSNVYHWKQEPVFIEDVQFVQSPEGVIPSLVRFYDIHDEVSDCFGGLCYQSAFDGSFKFIPGFAEWKSRMGVVPSEFEKNNIVNGKVESTFQIVKGISDDGNHVTWKGLSHLELQKALSRIRVFLDAKAVVVTCGEADKSGLKVVDVLLGPFNL
jgi:hypothetical protein